MKKLLTIVIAALILWSCGNKTEFILNGTVVPATNGSMVLYGFEKGNPLPVDTAIIVDGKFKFAGTVEVPSLYLMSIEGQSQYVAQLFVEPGKMNMTIYPDSFEVNVISGSKSHDIFKIYMDEIIKFSTAEGELQNRFRKSQMTGNEDEMEAIRFEYETMIDNTQFYAKNFIKQYSKSPVAVYVYLMNFFQEANLDELDSMINVFEPIKTSDFVIAMQERADVLRVSGLGAEAPDFTLNDLNGNPVSLSSLRGKYVLVDFWASWCQPCMIELPNVIEQYNAFKDKGFEVYGVSLDRDRDAWINAINAYQLEWVNAWDLEGEEPGAVANKYGVTGIPYTLLLDKEGKIIDKNLRGDALAVRLAGLLN